MRTLIAHIFKDNRGMTMIELVFASVVLLGSIITMVSMFDTSIDILQFTTARSMATQVANEEVEDIRAMDYEQVYNTVPTNWPDDPSLDGGSPPRYKDIDDDTSETVLRTIVTTTSPTGIVMERVVERKNISYTVRKYALWVDDGDTSKSHKRLIVKVSWTKPFLPGEVIITTNYAKEELQPARPSVSIIGVKSSNFNYFNGQTEDSTLGVDDSIRGTAVVLTQANVNSAKATSITRIEYTLYDSGGNSVATGEKTGPNVGDGWEINTASFSDGTGYLIKAEAFDSVGNSDIDALRVTIDNTNPAVPVNLTIQDLPGSTKLLQLTWDWIADAGDALPTVSRFMIERNTYGAGGGGTWEQRAAMPGNVREFFAAEVSGKFAYRIRAVDAAGNSSAYTTKERLNSPGDPDDSYHPEQVTSVTVSPASWKAADLYWSQVSDQWWPQSGMFGYMLVGTDDDSLGMSEWMVVGQSLDTTSEPVFYQDSGLKPGKTYWYAPLSFDYEGNLSYSGASVNVTTPMR